MGTGDFDRAQQKYQLSCFAVTSVKLLSNIVPLGKKCEWYQKQKLRTE